MTSAVRVRANVPALAAALLAVGIGVAAADGRAAEADCDASADQALAIESRAIATEDLEQRARDAPDYERAIDLFSEAIECDASQTTSMAALFSGRGLMQHFLGNDAAAVRDYGRAIEVDGGNDVFYERRAISLIFLGDYKAAVADFDRALELNADQRMPYTGRRAFALFYAGDFAGAEAGFADAIGLGDPRVHIPIWRHIAAARSSAGSRGTLTGFTDYRRDVWPGIVVDLMKGDASVEAVLAQTQVSDPILERNLRTEALFYIGQYYLLENRVGDAKVAFQQILKLGDRFFAEYIGAVAELDRLTEQRR